MYVSALVLCELHICLRDSLLTLLASHFRAGTLEALVVLVQGYYVPSLFLSPFALKVLFIALLSHRASLRMPTALFFF